MSRDYINEAKVCTRLVGSCGLTGNMYIITRIITILMLVHRATVKSDDSGSKSRAGSSVSLNFPSRLYLPASAVEASAMRNSAEVKNRARIGSDIDAVLENDLQVIPLVVDHDRRNGFQYQPIISREYSPGSTESPRYSQSAVPNLPTPTWNTVGLESPISNVNDPKLITKSQLSREAPAIAIAYSTTPKKNNPTLYDIAGGYSRCSKTECRFQSHGNSGHFGTTVNLSGRKILTVNDQKNNTLHRHQHQERIPLQLTPPRDGISRISRQWIDRVLPTSSPNSPKDQVRSISEPAAYHDVKPVLEHHELEGERGDQYPKYYKNHRDHYADENDRSGYLITKPSLKSTLAPIASGSGNDDAEFVWTHKKGQFFRKFVDLNKSLSGYNNGYNSQEHLPTDPILAVILSHYGKYLPGVRTPRVYAYMAVNNIHNNKPFGSYKISMDEDGSFIY